MESWRPDDPDEFALLVEAGIGPAGEPGGDLFWGEVAMKLNRFAAWEFEDYREAT